MPKKPLILIVDDDDAMRNATKRLMRALGFRAEAFGTAEDLLKSDRVHRAACIIADMQMPQMSGLEMHRRLVGSGTSIPTILITAYPEDSVRTRALEAGIICYLTKPFSKNDLLACIHSTLDRGAAGPNPEDNAGLLSTVIPCARLLLAIGVKKSPAGQGEAEAGRHWEGGRPAEERCKSSPVRSRSIFLTLEGFACH